jgi:hypothetical protein
MEMAAGDGHWLSDDLPPVEAAFSIQCGRVSGRSLASNGSLRYLINSKESKAL